MANADGSSAPIHDAPEPFSPTSFDGNPADLIIESSDQVRFWVHWAILMFVSSTFRDMKTMPQPLSGSDDVNPTHEGRPIICLSEPAVVLQKFLLLCYPRLSATRLGLEIVDLDGINGAYEAMEKYDVTGGTAEIEKLLAAPRFVDNEPHRVFAIACRHGLESLAKKAAKATLNTPLFSMYWPTGGPPPEYDVLPAIFLWRLGIFHQSCCDAVCTLLRESCDTGDLAEVERMNGHSNPYAPTLGYTAVWWTLDREALGTHHAEGCGPVVSTTGTVQPSLWFQAHVKECFEHFHNSADVRVIAPTLAILSPPQENQIDGCGICLKNARTDLGLWGEEIQVFASQQIQDILASTKFC
ncbi:hypothetical protein MIND_01380700 [Mycena indigotica]|uniref:BTB domain-containing protein n=1 Tax=Mycena indigotica TaxID=2126181 RepID=A0A8H6S0S8_9AGAR|nr:uncharacterized protein MIND_01380700 [Mycena indigotica]KAF7289195.1 hypothetical protein MIND_01380700 [Mycena indigotica]